MAEEEKQAKNNIKKSVIRNQRPIKAERGKKSG